MFRTGRRKLIGMLWTTLASTIVGVLGILHGSDLLGLAGVLGALNTPYLYFMGGNYGEWKARAADSSPLPDQLDAEKRSP